ncbi:hypothetical protein GKZ68_19620 [Hymenobacter sp. BRD128]|uniref:hypothetical protein n=1 Tax=Hymenobacter sp. BRD128 TaxID=2675878 RepID=UPI001565CB7D|nr:hypothetical protein [Hymenobacter sp. BRD128]QKG58642.1 hypothetical protein GKZ68_19620 [Hymenobacter sp. BRD128]
MDRNQATGLFLISALLLVYLFFFSPKVAPEKNKAQAPTTATTTKPAGPAPALAPRPSSTRPLARRAASSSKTPS